MFTGSNPVYHALVARASSRIRTAYRPKTVRTHKSYLTLLLQFLQFIQIDIKNMLYVTILAFMVFLQGNGLSHASIEAYVSSLKSQFKSLGLPLSPFTHHAVLLALRSMSIKVPVLKKTKGIFDLSTLHVIVNLCVTLGFVYKLLFLLAFFAFLRLSNMPPPPLCSRIPPLSTYVKVTSFLKLDSLQWSLNGPNPKSVIVLVLVIVSF